MSEFMQIKPPESSVRKFLPVMGMVLIIAFAAIAWAVHEPLRNVLVEQLDSLPQENEEGFKEVGYVAGGMLFLVLAMFGGLLYAAFTPKPKMKVTEKSLKDEKRYRELEKRDKQLRHREMRQAMAKDRKSKAKQLDPLDE